MLEIGSIIDGKYKILNVIGRGGMSVVYLAMNEKANKQWAIKEVRKDGVWNFEVIKQGLIVETDMLKKFNHPSLPSIVDVIDSDGMFLIVMDYIEGKPLSDKIAEQGALSQEEVIHWAKQLCDVLSYLHNQKPPIIYRDMKPANVMLRPNGDVTLIDFGTAREYKKTSLEDTTCLGTRGYAAPEQFGGQGQTDGRTDIYCLGATLYHLITGHNPSDPPYEMYPIRYWNPSLSQGLENIILKCTQNNPADRFQSCSELMYALEHYEELDDAYIREQKKKLTLFIIPAVLTLAFLAFSFFCYSQKEKLQINRYEVLMDEAAGSSDYDKIILCYLSAITLSPQIKEPYLQLIDQFTSDQLLSKEEDQIIEYCRIGGISQPIDTFIQLTGSKSKEYKFSNAETVKPFTRLMESPDEYIEVCYKIGEARWFYLETETDVEKKTSITFFDYVTKICEEQGKDIEEDGYYRKASLYSAIGSYYKDITRLEYEGSDAGKHIEFWENLKTLKSEQDKVSGEDAIKIRLFAEICGQIFERANKLKTDGVDQTDMEEMLTSIKNELTDMTVTNELLQKEVTELLSQTIVQAENAIVTAYSARTTEEQSENQDSGSTVTSGEGR
ncbi:serine/threonine protein kinase [Anaeromicropila populeti]|uniref:non-specific serine/threonine protein kinase n=1 Tax=Anaeromicropila populeti TaxID=37658 RepID=A0A1I6IQM9_9FIRM|nr:serine/threonine-protein kinase [Anaeromicropila populeti]SFR69016.1 serine/threonine protein kinase [Anaeromicropila populeti]